MTTKQSNVLRVEDVPDICESSVVIGCVAENNSKYLAQALRLVQSIRWFGGKISSAKIVVCVVDGINSIYKMELQRYSADIRIVERYSNIHPQSNKLKFLQQPDLKEYQTILLLDCDTVVIQDPTRYFTTEHFCAKIADGPTISSQLFKKIFACFQLPLPKEEFRCTVRNTPTIPYFNAGVLKFSQLSLFELIPKWLELNEKLIKQINILGKSSNFCEQASLSLAIASTNTKFGLFGNEMNFPVHHKDYVPLLGNVDPLLIHYHSHTNPSGYICESQYQMANIRISQFNDRLREEREVLFNNRLFWNFRYSEDPKLGSGIGSRGECLKYKRDVLRKLTETYDLRTILDVGCGDMEVGSILPSHGYLGVDVSDVVIERNSKKFTDRTFVCGNFLDLSLSPADMVVCMDVLIHLNDYSFYVGFVSKIVEMTIKLGVVAGYEMRPENGGIIFFHEPLSETLMRAGVTDIKQVGRYRDVEIFIFKK